MHSYEGKSVILTFDEIRILLYSLGYSSCEGVFMPEKVFSPQEILRSVCKMEKRGILKAGDGNSDEGRPFFVMDEELERMMHAIGNPGGTFEYRPGDHLPGFSKEKYDGPEYFCYVLPDYFLVTERDWTRQESLRLRAMNADSFQKWREEREAEAHENGPGDNSSAASESFLDESSLGRGGEGGSRLNIVFRIPEWKGHLTGDIGFSPLLCGIFRSYQRRRI